MSDDYSDYGTKSSTRTNTAKNAETNKYSKGPSRTSKLPQSATDTHKSVQKAPVVSPQVTE